MTDKSTPSFRLTILLPSEEANQIRSTPLDDFFPEVVDANLRFEFDGKTPEFPTDDHRITEDRVLRSVPIFDFLRRLIAACEGICKSAKGAKERAYLTSTDYVLEFYRKNGSVEAHLVHIRPDKSTSLVAKTTSDVRQLVAHCGDVTRAFLTAVSDMNPELSKDSGFQGLLARVESLSRRVATQGN